MTESKSNDFNTIRVWVGDDTTRGRVEFDALGPYLIIESGNILGRNRQDVFYEVNHEIETDENGEQFSTQLHDSVIVQLTPTLVTTRPYNRSATEIPDDIYPPSSSGWYGRMVRGDKSALYIVQKLEGNDKFWMTVLDPDTSIILECHLIHRYEIEALHLVDSFEHFNTRVRFFGEGTHEEMKERVMKLLDETELSWEDIHILSRGMNIPIISRGRTSRETLIKLFPTSAYPENTREEVLAFLTWTAKKAYPRENLVDFVENLRGMPTFRSLSVHHLRMLIDSKPIPSYLKLATFAATDEYSHGQSIQERQSQRPHQILRYKVREMAPDWQTESIQVLKSLDNREEISLVLPESKRARLTERTRFLMSTMGFSLRAYVQPMNVGLQNIVFLGVGYRWTHHLSYSYSLNFGMESGSPLYIQSMIVPPIAAKRIESVLPEVHTIGWLGSSTNYKLFRQDLGGWTMNSEKILASPDKSVSLGVLKTKFGGKSLKAPYHLTRKEARMIDMVNSGVFYLTHLETEKGQRYWNTTEKEAKRVLTDLRDKGVIDISYRFRVSGDLSPVTLIVEGQPKSVYSISKALLDNCPTTRTLISGGGSLSINTCRIPEEQKEEILDDLPRIAKENDITIRPFSVTGFRNYEGSLYQRIIRDDGTYDDDVSTFLSQIKPLSKSQKVLN
ncbi:MAG: hypothetical protein P1Q69_02485 [Candidatus Thorarchaeota archaeon]|nr:hypothetical protein [Candidatus Thorarchaeota archaeon]